MFGKEKDISKRLDNIEKRLEKVEKQSEFIGKGAAAFLMSNDLEDFKNTLEKLGMEIFKY